MTRRRLLLLLGIAVLLFAILVPVIPAQMDCQTYCQTYCIRHGLKCPIAQGSSSVLSVYWSLTAYYLGMGAYYGEHFGYGIVS